MELGVSHEQSLGSSTPIVDNIFDKYNKNLVPIRSLSDHDTEMKLFHPYKIVIAAGCSGTVIYCGRTCGGTQWDSYILRRDSYILRRDGCDLMI